MRNRFAGAGLALMLAFTLACGSDGVTADDVAGIEPAEVAEALGGDCASDVDYGDLLVDVARTEEWLEVVGVDESVPLDDYSTQDGTTEDLPLTVRPVVRVDDVGAEVDRTIAVHTTFLPGIAWGLEHDARAFVGMQSEGLVRPTVGFVLVQDTEDAWFVPGLCPTGGLERVLSEHPGRIEAVIGMTDPVAAEAILRGTATSTTTTTTG